MSRVKSDYLNDCQRMNFMAEQYPYCQLEEQEIMESMLSKIDALSEVLSAIRSGIEDAIDEIVLEGAASHG